MNIKSQNLISQFDHSSADRIPYLVLRLADEYYALEASMVSTTLKYSDITRVIPAEDDPFIKMHIYFGKRTIPVMDMREKMGKTANSPDLKSIVLVIETDSGKEAYETGILVDGVREILNVSLKDIVPVKENKLKIERTGIEKMIVTANGKICVLNLGVFYPFQKGKRKFGKHSVAKQYIIK